MTKFIPDGKTELTKWSVRLRIPVEFDEPNGITTCIIIRDKLISTRTLSEEEQKQMKEGLDGPPFIRRITLPPPTSAKPTTFRTATVTRGDIAATIGATGTIEPEEICDVASPVAGPVLSIGVDPRARRIPTSRASRSTLARRSRETRF